MEEDKGKSSVLRRIHRQTENCKLASDKLQVMYDQKFELAKCVRSSLENIFLFLKSKGRDDDLQLDDNNNAAEDTAITVWNMNQYLGILEMKANEILR